MRFLQNDYFKQRTGAKTSCKFNKSHLALNNPFQSFGGKEFYPSIQAKAARLCYGLVKNHAMIDGNKRLVLQPKGVK